MIRIMIMNNNYNSYYNDFLLLVVVVVVFRRALAPRLGGHAPGLAYPPPPQLGG